MEEYSATHSETVEELLQWPWLRVEKFYEAYTKRKVIEELKAKQIAMYNAIYANTNYDSKENNGKRDQIVQRLEEQLEQISYILYNGKRLKTDAEKEMENNPFFTVGRQALVDQGILDE